MAMELETYLKYGLERAAPRRLLSFEATLKEVQEKAALGKKTPRFHFATVWDGHLYYGFDITRLFWKQTLLENIAPPQSKGRRRLWARNLQITDSYIQSPNSLKEVGRSFSLSYSVVSIIVRQTIEYVWKSASPEIKKQFPLPLLPLAVKKSNIFLEKAQRRHELKQRIIELRAQGLENKNIREQLGLTPNQYKYIIYKLLNRGEIIKYQPRSGRGSVRFALEKILDRCLAQDPNRSITLAKLAREIGVTRERVRQLYGEIAAQREVPPVISRRLHEDPEKIYRTVAELKAQGLSLKQISEKLNVTQRLIKQAQTRNAENKLAARRNRVKELRNQGYGDKKIAEITGISLPTVKNTSQNLIRKNEVKRLRRERKTREEV